ncbi:carbohydrate kinase family protein [Patescibacteria group bacterium]|nr:carbohydrate kinase family protein [Patescibacteria group bacterium]
MYDVISIGDTTVDVFLTIDDATVLCDLDRDTCNICINYADKIPVSNIKEIPGVGNAANNAVGNARLGLNAALYTHLGDDDAGEDIAKVLKKENIVGDFIVIDAGKASNYSSVLVYKGERTILVYHEPRDYHLPDLGETKWIYLSSVAPNHQILHDDVYEYIHSNGVKLGFNPGTHQIKDGLRKLKPLMSVSEVFIVNREEAQRIVGRTGDIHKLLDLVYEHGPKIVIITDGKEGSYCFDGNAKYHLPVFDAPVVERTGCGDAYSTGFIAALVLGKEVKEAMKWGTVSSAAVLQKIGAQEGLLSRDQIEEKLASADDSFNPKEI